MRKTDKKVKDSDTKSRKKPSKKSQIKSFISEHESEDEDPTMVTKEW